jgi:hypothetical protein
MPKFFHVNIKEHNNMEQFFNEAAENEVMSHCWHISVASLGLRVPELQEKYYGQNKIRFMPYEVQETKV